LIGLAAADPADGILVEDSQGDWRYISNRLEPAETTRGSYPGAI